MKDNFKIPSSVSVPLRVPISSNIPITVKVTRYLYLNSKPQRLIDIQKGTGLKITQIKTALNRLHVRNVILKERLDKRRMIYFMKYSLAYKPSDNPLSRNLII